MKTEIKCISFADKIHKILRAGLILNRETLHYIDSTFLNPSVKDLESILNDASEPDRDALVELIFFPDEWFQAQLEQTLEHDTFHTDDEEKIIHLLIEKKTATVLLFPDKRKPLRVVMPYPAAQKFVSRLNISKQLDHNILDTINTQISPEYRDLIKVKLRNSKLTPTRQQIFFICSFFKTAKVEESIFFQCLNFILNFLDEMDQKQNITSALQEKKNYYHQTIRKADQFEKQISGNNMEMLILQGTRIPHISKEEAHKKIELIDRISLAVFGQTGYPEPDDAGLDFGSYHGEKDIGKLIKILS